ncbi:MAG: aldehyde dehydrogenase family protein [candidate division Zixibacteria bacterium]|nr:aldehyde dehydrogenase family protein [candidate division Zixibacteria bacterium]
MADSTQQKSVEELVRRVLSEITDNGTTNGHASKAAVNESTTTLAAFPRQSIIQNRLGLRPTAERDGLSLFSEMDQAIDACRIAQRRWLDISLEQRLRVVANIRFHALAQAERIGRMAVTETGMGKMPDKMNKIILCANKTPGPEDLHPVAYSGDRGLTLVEPAPWGVMGIITPSTNPAATVLNNSISAISAGNGAVFCPHPMAKGVSAEMAKLVHDAITEAGGPENLIVCLISPTIETAQTLMKHRKIDLILVTGGGAVVKQAMTCGKRAICAGPGNPPVLVDETAILSQAGRDIVVGASFDNNVLCTDEKEIFVVDKVAHKLKHEMVANGAYELVGANIDKLMKILIESDLEKSGYRHVQVNRKFIGKSPEEILKQIDVVPPPGTKLVFFESAWDHPMVMAEQLMPVIPFVRVKTVEEGMEKAVVAEHNYKHTFVMHSTSIVNLSNMSQLCRSNIFVKNGSNMAGLGFGGEGYASMSIAGTTGEGITKASTFTRPRRCTLVDYFRII